MVVAEVVAEVVVEVVVEVGLLIEADRPSFIKRTSNEGFFSSLALSNSMTGEETA